MGCEQERRNVETLLRRTDPLLVTEMVAAVVVVALVVQSVDPNSLHQLLLALAGEMPSLAERAAGAHLLHPAGQMGGDCEILVAGLSGFGALLADMKGLVVSGALAGQKELETAACPKGIVFAGWGAAG